MISCLHTQKPPIKKCPFIMTQENVGLTSATCSKRHGIFTLLCWLKQTKMGFTVPVGQWFSTFPTIVNGLFLLYFCFRLLISPLSMLLPSETFQTSQALPATASWAELLSSLLTVLIMHCLDGKHSIHAGEDGPGKHSFSSLLFPAPAMPLSHSSFPFPAPAASARV